MKSWKSHKMSLIPNYHTSLTIPDDRKMPSMKAGRRKRENRHFQHVFSPPVLRFTLRPLTAITYNFSEVVPVLLHGGMLEKKILIPSGV